MVTTFFQELHRRDKLLAWVGWFHLALLALMLMIAPFDSRTVMGINPWIKPMKFCASIAIYLWTVAWFLGYLKGPQWATALIRWGVSSMMIIEIIAIVTQAARGTTSHWNTASGLDSIFWSAMSFGIMINTMLEALLLVLFFVRPVDIQRLYLWGIRLGLFVFLVLGSAPGFLMVFGGGHTVGAPDGGPGLPLVNWSTQAGDLRIAHLMGLHGFQILPLVGFWLSGRKKLTVPVRYSLLGVFSVAYVAIALAMLFMAMQGRPLISFT